MSSTPVTPPDNRNATSRTAAAPAAADAAPARVPKASGRRHKLTPEESRAIDILDEQERAAGGRRRRRTKPDLEIDCIVEWAVEHHARTRRWPDALAGVVEAAPWETWGAVCAALRYGVRGLPGGTSLARVLAERVDKPYARGAPRLTEDQILAWADAYRERMGKWPVITAGTVPESPKGDTWAGINSALEYGSRGLAGGVTLARLLADRRGRAHPADVMPLTEEQILAWADAHRAATGSWPTGTSGQVLNVPGENWSSIDRALVAGNRALPGGSSMPRLLQRARGVRNIRDLPNLTEAQIVAWAEAYRGRTGDWPKRGSGLIPESDVSDTWATIDSALQNGSRGMAGRSSLGRLLDETHPTTVPRAGRGPHGRSSLARLLHETRQATYPRDREPLTEAQILLWADAHRDRTGRWPTTESGAVEGVVLADGVGEMWRRIDTALRQGDRGLPGGASLARLLKRERGVPNIQALAAFTRERILEWADAHHARSGRWPSVSSGGIVESVEGDTWRAVDAALREGWRGFPGGSSLSALLNEARPTQRHVPLPLTEEQILRWADAHHERTGDWPTPRSGVITDPEVLDGGGDTWARIDSALNLGNRGLPGGSSLLRLLERERAVVPVRPGPPPLAEETILRWAEAHRERTGRWPASNSGAVLESPGDDTWGAVDAALRIGLRGLAGGSSLSRLLEAKRGVPRRVTPPRLTVAQILAWAEAYRARTGRWPSVNSGTIEAAPGGDTWAAVNSALRHGTRGLPGGSSLPQLLQAAERRAKDNPPRPKVHDSEPQP